MGWGRTSLVLLCELGLGCGRSLLTEVSEAEGGTEGAESTGGESDPTAPNPTATNPTTTTPTTTSSTTANPTTTSPTATSPTATGDTGPDPGTGSDDTPPMTTIDPDSGGCPVGAEGCPCDVPDMCDDGLECNPEGICEVPPACRPIDLVPHGDEGTAVGLATVSCDTGMDLGVIGTIEGPETDWYTYFGDALSNCFEEPAAFVTAGVSLEVCVFLECDSGEAIIFANCAMGSIDAISPDGRVGCCGDGVAFIDGYDCNIGFGNKDVDVYISIGSDENVCADYGLEYQL